MDIFLARQAIYDRENNIVAYEMLFRNSQENKFSFDINEDNATIRLITNCVTIGLDKIISDKKAFINFTKGLILKDIASILPKEKVRIEVLENVEADEEIINELQNLKDKGYTIALDDVNNEADYNRFGNIISIYKIDFRATGVKKREEIIREIKQGNPSAQILAEKIETEEEYKEALENGYDLFQGFYFSKPTMIQSKDILIRNQSCFSIITELMKEDFDINVVEKLIKTDVAISYKIIRILNSASFSFVQKISSIKQAIMMLGKEELRKWLTMIAISEVKSDNKELNNNAIIRGRFAELIAEKCAKDKAAEAFMAGLFSNLDIYMQRNMKDIVEDLPVEEELKRALVDRKNTLGYILNIVEAYEFMKIERISYYAEKINVDNSTIVQLYVEAIEWVNNLVNKSFNENFNK